MIMGLQSDILHRIGWALRQYGVIAVSVVVLTVALATFVALRPGQQHEYEATALVAATELEISARLVPRSVQAVFNSGRVASHVARELGLETDPRLLVPAYIAMEPVQDSTIFLVRGYATHPEEAARRANSAAVALVDELNSGGRGIGTFIVQALAESPSSTTAPTFQFALAVGLAAGTLFALVLIAAIAKWTPAVLTPNDAEAMANAPALATLKGGEAEWSSERPLGLRTFLMALSLYARGGFVLVSTARSSPTRERVARLLDVEWSTSPSASERPTSSRLPGDVHTPDPGYDGVSTSTTAVRTAGTSTPARMGQSVPVIVVVERGERALELQALVGNWRSRDVVGLVFVERGRGRWLWRRGRTALGGRQPQQTSGVRA